jgi:iron(III) transport system substrate-binding protein
MMRIAILLGLVLAACGKKEGAPGEVVLYTSLNEPTTRAVTDLFEKRTGVKVVIRADTERDKTVGLVRRLIEERPQPKADVFWCSETANMVRLKSLGVLAKPPSPPKGAERIPAQYKDPGGEWYGFAARARVLIVNTDLVPKEHYPKGMWDILGYEGTPGTAIVKPVTGTTLTHVTALYEVIGEAETDRFLEGILGGGVNLPPGNGRLATLVGEGQIAFGFTDTSDYRLVKSEGKPVDVVYPDQDGIGTLVLPNTVALVRGGPNPANGARLLEFLLSDEAEEILANHPRGHIPLKPGIGHPADVKLPGEFRTMAVDFAAVGAKVEERLEQMNERFP